MLAICTSAERFGTRLRTRPVAASIRILDVVDEPEHQHDVVGAELRRVELEHVGLPHLEALGGNTEVIAEEPRAPEPPRIRPRRTFDLRFELG
jgi:hypothetical protein